MDRPIESFSPAEREAMVIVHAFTSLMVYATTLSADGCQLASEYLEGPVFLHDDKASVKAVVALLRTEKPGRR